MVSMGRFLSWILVRVWLGMFLWTMGIIFKLTIIGAPIGQVCKANSYRLMRL